MTNNIKASVPSMMYRFFTLGLPGLAVTYSNMFCYCSTVLCNIVYYVVFIVTNLHRGPVVCTSIINIQSCGYFMVHSCQQKSIGLKFSKFQTGNDVRYSCHHNSSRFTFPIFAHSCRFSVLYSLQSITPRIY